MSVGNKEEMDNDKEARKGLEEDEEKMEEMRGRGRWKDRGR